MHTTASFSQERVQHFCERFPLLLPTVDALNRAGIPFMIGGSGCLFVLGNERLPDDVDIYLPDDRHDEADALLRCESYWFESTQEHVRNSNPEGNHTIQLTSHLRLNINDTAYDLSLNQRMLDHGLEVTAANHRLMFYPPEDVLLIKALLRRGPDVGKHDLEDIAKFLTIYPGVRHDYLNERIQTFGAADRVGSTFSQG